MAQVPARQGIQRLSLIIFVAVLAVYGQVATFDFTNYDDHFYVTENQAVLQGLTLANLLWALTDFSQGSWQPLTWLSHMLDYQVFGLNPAGHHLVSAAIHALNSALLAYVLFLYTGAVWRSSLVAVLFAIHPLHVESVAWISERRDVLSGFWMLLSLWRYRIWCHSRNGLSALWVALSFLGGLMSKPIVVTLPLVFLLLDIWPLRRLSLTSGRDAWRQRRTILALVGEKVPLLLMALVSSGLTIFAEGGQGTLGSLADFPMTIRAGNSLLSYVRYLGKTLWPTSLLPFYPYPEVLGWQVALALVVLVVVTVYCVRQFNHHPFLLTGWLWYLITLLPVIGIIQQGEFAMADRYTYLPLIGIFVMLVWAGAALVNSLRWWRSQWTIGLVAILLGTLTLLNIRQTGFWRDTPSLFAHTLRLDPDNFKALLQLGAYHRDRGELDQARDYFSRVLQQLPNNLEALANQGDVYDKMGRLDEAERYFLQALAISPGDSQVYASLGVLKTKQGDLQAAVVNFSKALGLQPANLKLRINLGGALYLLGQLDQAGEQFVVVLDADPSSADAYNGLGLVALGQGRYREAVSNFQQAVRINPLFQSAQENLREALAKVGEAQ